MSAYATQLRSFDDCVTADSKFVHVTSCCSLSGVTFQKQCICGLCFTLTVGIVQGIPPFTRCHNYALSCSSNAFASFRSRVSNPSVNHP